jgi:hypothetical protein
MKVARWRSIVLQGELSLFSDEQGKQHALPRLVAGSNALPLSCACFDATLSDARETLLERA